MIYAAAGAASQALLRAETGDRGDATTDRRGDSVARPFHAVFLPKRESPQLDRSLAEQNPKEGG